MTEQLSLLETPAAGAAKPEAKPEGPQPAGEPICLTNLQASRLLGIAGWRSRRFEKLDVGGLMLTGAVYPETYKSGPRKGGVHYGKPAAGTERTIVLSDDARAAFSAAWEAETAKCHRCTGTQVEWVGWGEKTGNRYVICTRCKGTGSAPGAAGSP